MKKRIIAVAVMFGVACMFAAAPAQAHLVAFGWKDNGNGTVTMFGEHWHGDQISAYSDNGGVRVGVWGTDPSGWYLAQWTGVMNNVGGTTPLTDAMVTAGTIDGWSPITGQYSGSSYENDWFFTVPLVLGNGDWGLFTGYSCCVDTMDYGPQKFTISGISSVPEGTGPGAPQGDPTVPEPATMALLGSGLLGFGIVRRKRA